MPNVNLPSGNTIYLTAFEYYFMLSDEDMHEFYQSCMADNLGVYIDDPFSGRRSQGRVNFEEEPDIEEVEDDIKD